MTMTQTQLQIAWRRLEPLRRSFVAALLAACACASSSAGAQELGTPGNLAFTAERLFGLYFMSRTQERNRVDIDLDTTVIGLGSSGGPEDALLRIPRLGVDYFVDQHLTLGGSFGLASVSVEDVDVIGIELAARVGYALRLSHEVYFWPRGGLTFVNVGGDRDQNVFALTLEGMFSLSPSDGWSFLVGPILDLGFVGEYNDADYTEILFGIMFGLTGWLNL